jgi:hypothetical protein
VGSLAQDGARPDAPMFVKLPCGRVRDSVLRGSVSNRTLRSVGLTHSPTGVYKTGMMCEPSEEILKTQLFRMYFKG